MTLAEDLLIQAKHLALLDTGKPKQANLRRAVSAAYYALFHLLADDGAAAIGSRLNNIGKARIRRAFSHADMKTVCSQYAKTNPASSFNPQISPLLVFPIDEKLRNVAEIFLNLQEGRHRADYDLIYKFNRMGVIAVIDAAGVAFRNWEVAKSTANAQVFLVDLVLRKSWSRV